MSGWVDLKIIFFVPRSFTTLPDFLTCSLLFRRMSGRVNLTIFFPRISFIQSFSGFPYLLTTFSKDLRLSWPQFLFSYLAQFTSNRGFDTENDFRKGSPTRVIAPNMFLVSRLVDLRIGFWPQKGHPKWSPGRVLAKTFARLVDFRSGFWHWKWLPEGVTHSSTSQFFFFISR